MRRAVLALILPLAAACATSNPAPRTVVDLTYPFSEKTLYWPNSPTNFQLTQNAHGMTSGGYFYAANSFCAPEHGGTHLDSPIHFSATGRTVEQIPVSQLVAPGIVIDVSDKASADADYRLTVDDITAWESRHGRIAAGSIVLLRTGWGSRYGDRKRYFGDDTPGATDNLHFPSYGEAAARLLVEDRRAGALGVDTPSIDYGQSRDFIVHRVAAAVNVPGLENVANLDRLPARGMTIVALPMNIAGGSGAPLRIIALLKR